MEESAYAIVLRAGMTHPHDPRTVAWKGQHRQPPLAVLVNTGPADVLCDWFIVTKGILDRCCLLPVLRATIAETPAKLPGPIPICPVPATTISLRCPTSPIGWRCRSPPQEAFSNAASSGGAWSTASAMPDMVLAHICACVPMMAEMAADRIRGLSAPEAPALPAAA